MESTHLAALLEVSNPSYEEVETLANRGTYRQARNAILTEICSLSGLIEFPLFGSVFQNVTVDLLDHEWESERPTRRLYPPVLRLEVDVPFAVIASVDFLSQLPENQARAAFIMLCHRCFMKRVQDLLLIANVSRMGSIEIHNNVIIQDGHEHCDVLPPVKTWHLQAGLTLAESIGWPPVRVLPLLEAWQWAVEHKDYLDGFANSATGRALNALSHILQDSYDSFEPIKLIWALVGIEALYVEGSAGLRQQVVEKSQTVLGALKTHKKKIGQMYDWRSRFLHGDLDFPPLHVLGELVGDGRPQVDDYYKGLFEATEFAAAILVATLQTIIQRNWNGLDFTYKVDDLR